MKIETKFAPEMKVIYVSKATGLPKTGVIEKVFTNTYVEGKSHIGYFIKGVKREFKEIELKQA